MENLRKTLSTTSLVYNGTIFVLTPLSIISAGLNLVAYIILRKAQFSVSTIFRFLRINVLNSFFVSLLLATRFTAISYSAFDFSNSYQALFYGSYFYIPFLSILYLNGNLLNICITIERIMNFRPLANLKHIMKSKHFWVILFTISIVINIPIFFISYPAFIDYRVENNLIIRKYFYKLTDFSTSILGKVVTFLIYFVRDVLSLLAIIYLNMISINLIKKYINKISSNLKVVCSFSAQEIIIIGGYSVKKGYMTVIDRNLTFIGISMSVLALFENIFYIAFYISIALKFDEIALNLYFFSNLFIAIKHSSNLFILYYFNSVFKKALRNFFPLLFKKDQD